MEKKLQQKSEKFSKSQNKMLPTQFNLYQCLSGSVIFFLTLKDFLLLLVITGTFIN